MIWTVEEDESEFFVVNGDHIHPIPFNSKRMAQAAADRLNDRDERAASSLRGSGDAA